MPAGARPTHDTAPRTPATGRAAPAATLDTGDRVLLSEPVGGFFRAQLQAGRRGIIIANNQRTDGTYTVQFLPGPCKRVRAEQLIPSAN
jgi:hypothetical protein